MSKEGAVHEPSKAKRAEHRGALPGRRASVALISFLALANVAAWAWAWAVFGGRPALIGTALLAWVFGLRHAVDADHIAAIDNVVRKLMQEGRRPLAAGTYFSLGHSTIVIAASAGIAAAAPAVQARMGLLRAFGGIVGTGVSALFLLFIAIANIVILVRIGSAYRAARRGGGFDEASLNAMLAERGLLARLLRPVSRLVTRSWHMYPVGVLFGLGFDTATEVGLLGISAAQAMQGLSPAQILIFPALFTSGMALVDTTDSVLMVGAYGWAFADPLRKLTYNFAITAASVVVALLIGGIEALGLLGAQFRLSGSIWAKLAGLNEGLANAGFVVIGAFAMAWFVSTVLYRARRRAAGGGNAALS